MSKKNKLDADRMMLNNLSFMGKFGIKSIQMGSTNYKKKGKSALEITTIRKFKKNK